MDTREELLAELLASGVKHTPENVVAIGRDWMGRVVFLKTGDERAGYVHTRNGISKSLLTVASLWKKYLLS